jgi:hypothetical protein
MARACPPLGRPVGPDVGGSDVVGLYRVDGPDRFTVVADLGAFSIANPPATDFFVPSGVQYALQASGGRLLVTDGHHNRVLRVTRDGQISELRAFGNIVPTGLEVRGQTIYMAQAGPVPHLPEDGKVVAFPAEVAHRQGCGRWQPPAGGCGVRPPASAVRPLPGRVPAREP